jgi:hypothetical protein
MPNTTTVRWFLSMGNIWRIGPEPQPRLALRWLASWTCLMVLMRLKL